MNSPLPRAPGLARPSAASFDTSDCTLACYSAAGFSADLRSAAGPGLILVSSGDLYG